MVSARQFNSGLCTAARAARGKCNLLLIRLAQWLTLDTWITGNKKGRPAGLPFYMSVIVAMVTPFLRSPGWAVRTRLP